MYEDRYICDTWVLEGYLETRVDLWLKGVAAGRHCRSQIRKMGPTYAAGCVTMDAIVLF